MSSVTGLGLKNQEQANFIDRVKNEPKFREEAFRLQEAIKVAWEPGTDVQTWFGQNDELTLDCRKEGFVESFTDKELRELADSEKDGHVFKQQKSEDAKHPLAEQINVIAQGLAFTLATKADVAKITAVVNSAYNKMERIDKNWGEGFRTGDAVDDETVAMMIRDPDVTVMLCECPDGRGFVKNGTLLGVCCFSVGSSAVTTNSENDPPRGAVRILAVRPDFFGVYVGTRLLDKVEAKMKKAAAVALCMCVPSSRKSLSSWVGRRGYKIVAELPYPKDQVPFEVVDGDETLKLLVFEKKFAAAAPKPREPGAPVALNLFEEAEAALRGLTFKPGEVDQSIAKTKEELEAVDAKFKELNQKLNEKL
jgi:hypothetical protein